MNQLGAVGRIIGHPVERVAGVAGTAHGRGMIVDTAVVGFPRQWGVGDGDQGHRQSRALSILGQQHRAQRLLTAQPPALVEAKQSLRPAVHPRHGIDVHQVRRRRWPTRAVHPVDLDRGVARAQAAVGNEPLQRPRTDRVAELGDLGQPRRTVDGLVHQDGARRARGIRIQIVAHHHIRDALSVQRVGEPRRRPARGEEPLHRVQRADGLGWGQRNGIAHPPGAVTENL